jgi:dienelactone hydrolase
MPFTPFRFLRPGYVEDAAEDSWKRMLAFFDMHVRGGR